MTYLHDIIQTARLVGGNTETARAYALAHLEEILECMRKNGFTKCDTMSVMMNGPDLLELIPEGGEEMDRVPTFGVGCSENANFGGLGIHFRMSPRSDCAVQ